MPRPSVTSASRCSCSAHCARSMCQPNGWSRERDQRSGFVSVARPGTFKPGQSGNPGGRPKAIMEVIELARQETLASIGALIRVRDGVETPPAAVVAASCALLDRGWGKAKQPVSGSPDEEMPALNMKVKLVRS